MITVVGIHADSLLTEPGDVYSRRRRNTWDDEEEDYDF